MAKLPRVLLKLFGADGPDDEFAKFGSQVAGSPVKTKDITTIQSLSAWLGGLKDAVYPSNKAPFLEDINSLFYVLCYQAAYALQDGIPEWESLTSYYIGSVVRKTGTMELYMSKIDDNVGNALPSKTTNANWRYMNGQMDDVGTIKMRGAAAVPDGWLPCDGSAVSRTTYADLFAVIGTTWGVGDGATTFNVPDLLGRAPVGAGSGSGLTPRTLGTKFGAETHTNPITGVETTMKVYDTTSNANNLTSGENIMHYGDGQSLFGITSGGGTYNKASAVQASHDHGGQTGAGSSVQPSAAVTFIIKT